MTKVLHCQDVTGACDAVVRGETDEEILAQVGPHARERHGLETVPPELAEQARRSIREER